MPSRAPSAEARGARAWEPSCTSPSQEVQRFVGRIAEIPSLSRVAPGDVSDALLARSIPPRRRPRDPDRARPDTGPGSSSGRRGRRLVARCLRPRRPGSVVRPSDHRPSDHRPSVRPDPRRSPGLDRTAATGCAECVPSPARRCHAICPRGRRVAGATSHVGRPIGGPTISVPRLRRHAEPAKFPEREKSFPRRSDRRRAIRRGDGADSSGHGTLDPEPRPQRSSDA
jgi:hypothetical protein